MNFGDLKTSYVVCMLSCGEFSKGSGFFLYIKVGIIW